MYFERIVKKISYLTLICVSFSVFADKPKSIVNKTNFHIDALFLQPNSSNLKYAVFVSGNQPLYQSWHNKSITPGFTPAFEVGFNYAIPQSDYNASIDWLHFNSNDSASAQASENTDIATVQFVAPPYDVGPAVFSIKRAISSVNNNFNSVGLNVGKMFEDYHHVQVRVFGGINILRLNQTLNTTFSDNVGSPLIPSQAYPVAADPNFYFQTSNVSKYLGAGPDLGVNIQYVANNDFGLVGQFMGTLTAGSMSAVDNFTSASNRLRLLGITTSTQQITAPDTTQVVPGFDSKLGILFNHSWQNSYDLSIEAGYRFAYYINAISGITPATLVQAGLDATIPEFATGTMAINSTDSRFSPFSLQGPYLKVTLGFL